MTFRTILASTAILAAMTVSLPASAQDVVMRRPIPVTRSAAGGTSWKTTPWVIYDGSGNAVNIGDACGDYVERRDVTCVRADGVRVDDYFCSAVPKPPLQQNARHDEGCTYTWSHGDWVDPGPSCSLTEEQTRSVTCQRDTDHAVMADSFCGDGKPAASQQVNDFSTCTYTWKTGDFVDAGPTCTDAEHQTRPITCERDLDHASVDVGMCDPAKRPADGQDVRDISACTYTWKTGDFVDPGASCTRSETQTRDVTCRRSLNDEVADDASCTAEKPSATQTVADYATCTFKAVDWTGYTPSSTCAADATKTRTAKCQRSNDGGEIVDDAQCAAAGVALSETVPEANYSTCSNSWVGTGFADPGANCGNETWTQGVSCQRDLDHAVQPDGSCDAATRPKTEDVRYDTSSCGYEAVNWTAYTPSSTCSATATKTRTAQCRRSDGQIVDGSECTSRGKPVTETVTEANYSTCSNSWVQSGYVDPGASCGPENWTQDVTCKRDLDKAVMPDASCTGAKPSTTEAHTDYSSCSYSAANPSGWTPSSTCSASATKTRSYQCKRSDGTIVDNAECTSRSVALTETVPEANYSTCGYSAVNWGGDSWSSTCSTAATLTQTAQCQRSDGTIVANAECTSRGVALSRQSTGQNLSTCGYSAANWTAYAPSSTCSASATKTRTAQCLRSDGTIVADAECTNRSIALTDTVAEANYSTCSNSWYQTGYVDPGASCGNETWTQSVTCKRDLDKAVMADGACATAKPSTTEIHTDYSGCGYSAVNWTAYTPSSTCSASATKTRTAQCLRGDGTIVAGTECTSRGVAVSETVAEANYSTCSSSWRESGFVDPGNNCGNETWTQSVTCKRDLDNAAMPDAACTAARPSSTSVRSDTSGCTYSAVDHGYGACDGTNKPHYWDCTRSDGATGFPASMCGHQNPEYENCYSYQPNATASSCSGGTQTVTNSCRRSDGANVAASFCGLPPTSTQNCTSYAWYQSGFGGFSACQAPGVQYQYQTVYCQANNGGNLSQVDDGLCGGGKPATSNSQACTFYTYSWTPTGTSGWDSTCSASAHNTHYYACIRSPDGASVGGENCAGGNPQYTETQEVYSNCSYTTNFTGYNACPMGAGATQSRTVASCTRNQTGQSVDLAYCGGQRTETVACSYNPGGQAPGTRLGVYVNSTCSNQQTFTGGSIYGASFGSAESCRTGVAYLQRHCADGSTNYATCAYSPNNNNTRPPGYPCDSVCQ